MTLFIEEVVKNGGEVSKEQVVAFYAYYPEFERFMTSNSNWKTTTFKVCAGLGYRINPGLRSQQLVEERQRGEQVLLPTVPQEGNEGCPEH